MDDEQRFWELVDRYRDLRERRETPSIKDLCPDNPELAQQLRRWIEGMDATEWLCGPLDPVPSQLGRYAIERVVAIGGMGNVYKAVDQRMQRPVAVKIIKNQLLKNPGMMKRFHREVCALARLSHESIVTAYDTGDLKGTPYLVMQWIDGQNLRKHVRKCGPLAAPEALDYLLQTARGLAYAHGENVVHRDVKPSNLLLVLCHA